MLELAKTEVGRARIAKVTERTDHYLADRVAEGDERTAQGGIGRAVDAPPPLELIFCLGWPVLRISLVDNQSDSEKKQNAICHSKARRGPIKEMVAAARAEFPATKRNADTSLSTRKAT